MSRTTDELVEAINRSLRGHTDHKEEAQILALLAEAEGPQITDVLRAVVLADLISAIDDRLVGPDKRTALLDLLTITRLSELALELRVGLVGALQKGITDELKEKAIRNVFLGTLGGDLTALKNGIDSGEDYRDLQQLIFSDIDNGAIRDAILAHIEQHGSTPVTAVKALSDIDDTFYANLKDQRYPRGTTYPGVIQYYKELVRGPDDTATDRGTLVFLTARPKDRAGLIEGHTKHALSGRGIKEDFTVLSGDFCNLIDNVGIANKKFENFVQYQRLFPEYGFVFTGDSGQGDAIFGEKVKASFPDKIRGVFIHDVINTSPAGRKDWRSKGVVLFDTYVGAAVEACQAGLISKPGVQRVIDSAQSGLQTVHFADAQQRAAREADLQADIDRANGL